MGEFADLTREINEFVRERDWEPFHSPKNIAMALSVEAAELLEHFQWLTEEESGQLPEDILAEVADEIADVQWYLLRLANQLGISIPEAAMEKMTRNRRKYPVEKSRGTALKYDKL